jgi:raffinose/stachyose/melibiose transport system substrate-binding protein
MVSKPKPATGQQTPPPLRMWWWGEEEAPGISRWIEDTISRFQAETGVRVDASIMATSEVVDRFTQAARAGNPPDLQYFWNGIFHMENVWRGYVEPLNGLVSRSVLQRSGATRLSVFEGKQYRAGFYGEGFGIVYNKVMLDRAGLDPDDPPRTWAAFLNACDRLKAAGFVPFGGGARDGFFGDWWLANALPQNLNLPTEAISLFIGDLDWREPKHHEHWERLDELVRLGFVNDDIGHIGLFESLRAFDQGRFAFTLYVTASLPQAQASLGQGNVGFMPMPVYGRGRLAGVPILDAHGFGIPNGATHKRLAAQLIEFMHTRERLQAMWQLSNQIPVDEAFNADAIQDPLLRRVYEVYFAGPHSVYVGNLMPVPFWNEVMFVVSQRIVAGQMSAREAGDLAHAFTDRWRAANPELVSKYARWSRELAD